MKLRIEGVAVIARDDIAIISDHTHGSGKGSTETP